MIISGYHFHMTSRSDSSKPINVDKGSAAFGSLLRAVIETSADGFWVVGPTGRILEVNDAYLRRSGYTREEILSKGIADIEAREHPEEIAASIQKIIKEGRGIFEAHHRAKDGTVWPVEINSVYRPADGGHFFTFIRDITERKRIEKTLARESYKSQLFLRNASDGVHILDADGYVLEISDSFGTMLGYGRDELIGAHASMWDAKWSADEVKAEISEQIAKNDQSIFETRHRRKDGSIIDVEITGRSLELDGKQVLFNSARDVTERKQAAEAVRRSESRYRSLFENMLEGFALCKMVFNNDKPQDFEYIDVNNAFEQLTGLKNVVGKKVTDVIPGVRETNPELFEIYGRVALTGKPATFETYLDALKIWFSISAYCPEKGYFVAVFENITERKHAEQTLAESEGKLKAIFDAAGDGILLADPGSRKFVAANASICRMLGYSMEEMLQLGVADIHPEGALPAAIRTFNQQASGQIGIAQDLPMKRKDGRIFYADINATSVTIGGKPWLLGIFRDISERKRSELALSRVNRALKTLSSCNAVLVHAEDEKSLLQGMCRSIVEIGGYPLAWIGFTEHDPQKMVRPVAYGGYAEGYIEKASVSWADNALGQGPVGRAIRTRKPQLVRDATTDPTFLPWRANALNLGYRSVLGLPLISSGTVLGAICLYSSEIDGFDEEEIRLISELADDLAFGISALRTRTAHEESVERLQRSMESTVTAIAATVEMRDPYTAGHQRRVAELAVAIARDLGMPDDEIHGLYLAGIVHDLGKVNVPAEILSKPGKLANIEFELVKAHAQAGYDILKGIEFPWPLAEIVFQHHERLDGSGYPRRLKDAEILAGAKILAVADAAEAMASHRPYRPSLGLDAALAEITNNRGKRYDSAAVDACVKLFREKGFTFPQ